MMTSFTCTNNACRKQTRDLVRFSLRLEPSTLTLEQTEQCKLAPVESSTEFGIGVMLVSLVTMSNFAHAKLRTDDLIAKAQPRIETRRADTIACS